MCGKYNRLRAKLTLAMGSPPHVREIQLVQYIPLCCCRITPACAGNTKGKLSKDELKAGSPPHVREIPQFSNKDFDAIGITPACAGNTTTQPLVTNFIKDHPRMCGKYLLFILVLLLLVGSPPHVREIQINVNELGRFKGITPACAGNTKSLSTHQPPCGDHPRMCGKYTKRSIYDATCNLRIPFFHSLLNFQFIS